MPTYDELDREINELNTLHPHGTPVRYLVDDDEWVEGIIRAPFAVWNNQIIGWVRGVTFPVLVRNMDFDFEPAASAWAGEGI